MRSKVTKMVAGLAAIAALALGGSAIASANQHTPQTSTGVQQQSGGTSATGAADATAETTTESTVAESTETAGVENTSAESAKSDSPGGYADNPADATVNTEQQGVN